MHSRSRFTSRPKDRFWVTTHLRACREQKGGCTCHGRHPSGGQGAERWQNVPWTPNSGRAGNGMSAKRVRAAILQAGGEQNAGLPCLGGHLLVHRFCIPGCFWCRSFAFWCRREKEASLTCRDRHPPGRRGAECLPDVPWMPARKTYLLHYE